VGDIFEVVADGLVHRIACGDCTDEGIVGELMGDDKAVLSHDDPPYGMGKEGDGVVNDNLYREKLDTFQMAWWNVKREFLEDNASAYIWGNAEDLWRLWYVGGLKDSERLTFRSFIIWDKPPSAGPCGSPMGSDKMRSYPHGYESCLFFMLGNEAWAGQSPLSPNVDSYWDGYEPLRLYLLGERQKMGWDVPTMKRIVGHSDLSGDHWTSKSQWELPTKIVYDKLRQGASGKAFLRPYDELKAEKELLTEQYINSNHYKEINKEYLDFMSSRAYFNNTHELMTDVWNFPRVIGDERHGHATPKPVAMIERIIETSSRDGDIVLECFGGSGTTLIAAHQTGRQCRILEIQPDYVAVTLQRIQDLTGITPTKIN
jgi:DNA modification methylase